MGKSWDESIVKMSDFLTGGKVTPRQKSSKGANDPIKFVSKGWGYEKWIANCPLYCGKILFIAQGKKCSWHYHNLKDEVFYIQSGAVEVIYSYQDNPKVADKILLVEGDKFHVPTGMRHQMYALKDTELFEFSTEHFDSDSIRLQKGD
jgi:mannose-6-phosphate isomerase-like protein (cupin superfamily)